MKSEKLEAKLSHIQFYSATYRLWKLPNLEPDCEDYGQVWRLVEIGLPRSFGSFQLCHSKCLGSVGLSNSNQGGGGGWHKGGGEVLPGENFAGKISPLRKVAKFSPGEILE